MPPPNRAARRSALKRFTKVQKRAMQVEAEALRFAIKETLAAYPNVSPVTMPETFNELEANKKRLAVLSVYGF